MHREVESMPVSDGHLLSKSGSWQLLLTMELLTENIKNMMDLDDPRSQQNLRNFTSTRLV